MEKFKRIETIDCIVELFESKAEMSSSERRNLSGLIYEKTGGMSDEVSSMVSPEEDRFVLCAFDDRRDICAFASVVKEPTTLYLDELYVGCAYRKSGYGQKLLEMVRKNACKMEKDYVSLVVPAKNKNAQNLYEKSGFSYQSYLSRNSAFLMYRPVSNAVLYQGRILTEIASKFGVGNLASGYEKFLKDGVIEEFAGDFNHQFANNPIDLDAMRGACVLLDEYAQSGAEIEDLKYFMYKKTCSLSSKQKNSFSQTLAIGDEDKIATSARYAEEFLKQHDSERIKTDGMRKFERGKE